MIDVVLKCGVACRRDRRSQVTGGSCVATHSNDIRGDRGVSWDINRALLGELRHQRIVGMELLLRWIAFAYLVRLGSTSTDLCASETDLCASGTTIAGGLFHT